MKKILALILATAFLISFSGCNKADDTENPNITDSSNVADSSNITDSSNIIESSNITDSSNNTDSSKPDESSTPEPTISSTPHIHSYSNATCTSPAKCSCGDTTGSALDHSWQDATCKAPKTCKNCGITEGAVAEHNYVNGKCSLCGNSEYADINDYLKETGYNTSRRQAYILAEDGRVCMKYDLWIEEEKIWNEDGISWRPGKTIACISTAGDYIREDILKNEWGITDFSEWTKITYNGKNYYHGPSGDMPRMYDIKVVNNLLVLRDKDNPQIVAAKLALLNDGSIKFVECVGISGSYPNAEIVAGTVFTK